MYMKYASIEIYSRLTSVYFMCTHTVACDASIYIYIHILDAYLYTYIYTYSMRISCTHTQLRATRGKSLSLERSIPEIERGKRPIQETKTFKKRLKKETNTFKERDSAKEVYLII